MPLLIVIVLALIGGFVMYENDNGFRDKVDNFVENLEKEHHNHYTVERPQYQVQAAARPNTSHLRGRPEISVGSSSFRNERFTNLAERQRIMRENYKNSVDALKKNHSRDKRTTQAMNGYYEARYNRDAAANNYRRYGR